MSDEIGRHAQQFTGRGGAGNFVIKNPIPAENLPKQYSQKPVAGNFSGRGGAGNFATLNEKAAMPPAMPQPPISPRPPTVYKGGRGEIILDIL